MLSLSFSLRQKRVNFINENDSWLPTACNTKQCPDEFLTFTDLTHLLVKELADMEKKVAFASPAIAFPIMVLQEDQKAEDPCLELGNLGKCLGGEEAK